MSDTKNPGDKTLHVSPKTLSLKRPVEHGTVRQSFSHGRSKAVVVETVKRRAVGPGGKDEKTVAQAAAPNGRRAKPRSARPPRRASATRRTAAARRRSASAAPRTRPAAGSARRRF